MVLTQFNLGIIDFDAGQTRCERSFILNTSQPFDVSRAQHAVFSLVGNVRPEWRGERIDYRAETSSQRTVRRAFVCMCVCMCVCVCVWRQKADLARILLPPNLSLPLSLSPSFTLSLFPRPRERFTLLLFRRYLDCLVSGERRFPPSPSPPPSEQQPTENPRSVCCPRRFPPLSFHGRKLLSAKEPRVHTCRA